MEKIRFLKSVHGSYGEANPGDEKEVTKTLAHELVTSGIAEKVEGTSEGEKTEDEQTGNGGAGSSEPKPITSGSVDGEAKTDVSVQAEEPVKADEATDQDEASEDADIPAERRARRRRAD